MITYWKRPCGVVALSSDGVPTTSEKILAPGRIFSNEDYLPALFKPFCSNVAFSNPIPRYENVRFPELLRDFILNTVTQPLEARGERFGPLGHCVSQV